MRSKSRRPRFSTARRLLINFILSFLLLLLIVSGATASHIKNEERTFDVMPFWKKGEKLHYKMTKTRYQKAHGKPALDIKSTTPIVIEVLEAGADGYLISWTMGETKLEEPKQAKNPLVKFYSNLLKDFRIILKLDSHANIVEVKNWRDLQKTIAIHEKLVLEALRKEGLGDAAIHQIQNRMRSMVATKDQIEFLCTESQQLFFLAIGRYYPLSGPIEYQDSLPNPFGGEPFPSRVSLTFKKLDGTPDMGIVTWKQEIDPVAAKRVLETILDEFSSQIGASAPPKDLLKYFSINDSAEFLIHLPSGWPQRCNFRRDAKFEKGSRTETKSFLRVD